MAVDVLRSEVVGLYEAEVGGLLVPKVVSVRLEVWQGGQEVWKVIPSGDRREGASILHEVIVVH